MSNFNRTPGSISSTISEEAETKARQRINMSQYYHQMLLHQQHSNPKQGNATYLTRGSPTTLLQNSTLQHQVKKRSAAIYPQSQNPKRHVPPGKSRTSSKKRRSTRRNRPFTHRSITPRIVTTSVSCHSSHDSVCASSDLTPEDYPNSPVYSFSEDESLLPEFGLDHNLTPERFDMMFSCAVPCNTPFNNAKFEDLDEFEALPKLELPPNKTKSTNFPDIAKDNVKKKKNESNKSTNNRNSSSKVEEKTGYRSLAKKDETYKERRTNPARKFLANSPGIKLRINTPRIGRNSGPWQEKCFIKFKPSGEFIRELCSCQVISGSTK